MADTQKFRDRKFCAVLYPEDETHVAAIEKLKSGGYNFAAILHDKDVYEDGEHKGETKKSHWHVVVRFKNAVWNTAIAKELGIQPNYLEACANVDSAFGPLRVRLSTLLAEPDEGARVLNLVDIVDNTPGPIGYSELIKKAVAAGIYADLRRMGSIAVRLVNEHNYECYRELQHNSGVSQDFENFRGFLAFTGDRDIRPLDDD